MTDNGSAWMTDNRSAWMANNGIAWMAKNRTVWMPNNRTTSAVVSMAIVAWASITLITNRAAWSTMTKRTISVVAVVPKYSVSYNVDILV